MMKIVAFQLVISRFIWLGNKLSFSSHSLSRISLKLTSIESFNQGALQKHQMETDQISMGQDGNDEIRRWTF